MDTNKMREQFEAWAVTSAWLGLGLESEMDRDGDGYAETEVHTAWIAWQASRDWVAINLPSPDESFDNHDYLIDRELTVKAIEAHGLKVEVKP